MARILIETQSWGIVQDLNGNALIGQSVHIANTDGSAATTWSAQTGGCLHDADQATGSNGAIPRYIEEGEYDVTVGGVTKRVEASGTGPGIRITASATSATAVQAAITGLGVAGGEIVLLPGTHTWDVIVTIPPALTGKLSISTMPGATIALTTGARRCFDWGKLADYDTFQNVDIGPMRVDCQQLRRASSRRHRPVAERVMAAQDQPVQHRRPRHRDPQRARGDGPAVISGWVCRWRCPPPRRRTVNAR
jgi:hypothetical protein